MRRTRSAPVVKTIRSRSPQTSSSGQSIRLRSNGLVELREQAAAGVEDAHAALERADVAGERGDVRGVGGARVAEGEAAVDAADDRWTIDLGDRDRGEAQQPDQPLALDHREPARHVEARRGRSGRCRRSAGRARSAARSDEAAAERVADDDHLGAAVALAQLARSPPATIASHCGSSGSPRSSCSARPESASGRTPSAARPARRAARAAAARCRRCRRSRGAAAAAGPSPSSSSARVSTPASVDPALVRGYGRGSAG